MKKLFVYALLLAVTACSSVKLPVSLPLDETLPAEAKYSPGFRLFWEDYAKDVNQSAKKIKAYTPSEQLVNIYGLRTEGKTTYIFGFLTVAPDKFNFDGAKKAGVDLQKTTDKIYMFSCDVRRLPLLLGLEGVEYVELAKKAHLR